MKITTSKQYIQHITLGESDRFTVDGRYGGKAQRIEYLDVTAFDRGRLTIYASGAYLKKDGTVGLQGFQQNWLNVEDLPQPLLNVILADLAAAGCPDEPFEGTHRDGREVEVSWEVSL